MNSSHVQKLELALMAFEPETLFPRYLHSIDDVAAHRGLLRATPYSVFVVEYLIDLVWARVHESRRRNLIYGLNAIKWVIRNSDERTTKMPESTVDRLFELYQHFIFDRLEDIRWSVSAILRDKRLRKAQLKWLVDNHQNSAHIVNRILRYPEYDPLLASWARQRLFSAELGDRRSELLSRLIRKSLPSEAKKLSKSSVLWAIYYAPVEYETKKRLLVDQASLEALDDLIAICVRLGMQDVLAQFRNRMESECG